jgi:hypothetical protein
LPAIKDWTLTGTKSGQRCLALSRQRRASNIGGMIYLQRSFEFPISLPSFDGTRHRAMSLRCGLNGGLPIGMMLAARQFDESFVYRQARARTGGSHERSARLHRGHAEV